MLAACTSGMAQGVDGNVAGELNNFSFEALPGMFAKDGKSCLATYRHLDDGSTQVALYDDDINLISSFTMPQVENSLYYTIIDQREKIVIEYPDGYVDDRGFVGEWYKIRQDGEYSFGTQISFFCDINQGIGVWDVAIPVTQTLFNDDEEYEYIQPIYQYEIEKSELDRDDNGGIDYITTNYTPRWVGFKIMTATGKELQRVDFDASTMGNNNYLDLFIIKINDKYYLDVSGEDEETYETSDLFFRINRETSSVQKISAPIKGMSVRPRMQSRGGSFTVELDGDSNVERDVVVVNSAGQTVWEQKVPAGQKTVNISASRLSQGLNVVTVRGGKQPESCKVIVK